MKYITLRYKELSVNIREKLLYILSSFLGSLLFLILFESFYFLTEIEVGSTDTAFMISYLLSYIISIAWQHALHRLLIFSSASYCMSLLHTYFAYSVSLSAVTMFGTILINVFEATPRLVALLSMPLSAFFNFYLLTTCLDSSDSQSSAIGTSIYQTPFSPTQTTAMSSYFTSSPHFNFSQYYPHPAANVTTSKRFYGALGKAAAHNNGPVVLL
jgi:hypothetical protein